MEFGTVPNNFDLLGLSPILIQCALSSTVVLIIQGLRQSAEYLESAQLLHAAFQSALDYNDLKMVEAEKKTDVEAEKQRLIHSVQTLQDMLGNEVFTS